MSTSTALPSNETPVPEPAVPLRLREWRRDWFFVVMFSLFALTSAVNDTVNTVGRPDPHSAWFMARFLYNAGTDSLLIANSRFVQVTVGYVSALLLGVFYLMLIYAFVRGRDWIRLPAVFYAGMVVMGTGVYLAVGLLGDAPLFHLACGPDSAYDYKFVDAAKSLAFNLPYPLVALLLVVRMWRDRPFTR
jgi:EXPERA (EXPanded EBP superfamily)